jgi:YjjG family noncanonical pyrimidine nucleotidase
MKKYKYLLFDLDGTLFDYDQAEKEALKNTFAEFNLHFRPEFLEIYRRINAKLWADYEQGFISQEALKVERFSQLAEQTNSPRQPTIFSQKYLTHLSKSTHMIPDAERVIATLSKTYNIFLMTNGLSTVQRPRIDASRISQYIEGIFISGEIGSAKPEKEIFDYAFQQMNQPAKENVIIIGDSLSSDITGGNRYGIDTCWFNPQGKEKPAFTNVTFEIQALSQLLTLF